MKAIHTRILCAAAVLAVGLPATPAQGCQGFSVLVFSKTAGFSHTTQIALGTSLIQQLGATEGFTVDATDDASMFNGPTLAGYAAVIFLHTTGDVLNGAQEAAFENYVNAGGGFVGVHSAANTETNWPYFVALVGAVLSNHPAVQAAMVQVADPTHPSTAALPASFAHSDEWYNFTTNPASNPQINVLLTVDEGSYSGGTMGSAHPIAWYQDAPGQGRSWYTGLGHDLGNYTNPHFIDHLLGGILYAAGSLRTVDICGAQAYGNASGTPTLTLQWNLIGAASGEVVLAGGDPGGSGFLVASTCDASLTSGPFHILVDLDPTRVLATVPAPFDASGTWALTLPTTLQIPASTGWSLYFQGVEATPQFALTPGLDLHLCP